MSTSLQSHPVFITVTVLSWAIQEIREATSICFSTNRLAVPLMLSLTFQFCPHGCMFLHLEKQHLV